MEKINQIMEMSKKLQAKFHKYSNIAINARTYSITNPCNGLEFSIYVEDHCNIKCNTWEELIAHYARLMNKEG